MNCAIAPISSTPSSPRTCTSSSSDGRTLAGVVSCRRTTSARSGRACCSAARSGPADARAAGRGARARRVVAAVRGRPQPCSVATIDLDGRRSRSSACCARRFGGLDDFPRDIWLAAGPADAARRRGRRRGCAQVVTPAQAEAQLAAFAARHGAAGDRAARQCAPCCVPNATANPLSVELRRDALAGVRGLRARAGDGLLQRVERDAGARHRPSPRDRRATVARRQPRAASSGSCSPRDC